MSVTSPIKLKAIKELEAASAAEENKKEKTEAKSVIDLKIQPEPDITSLKSLEPKSIRSLAYSRQSKLRDERPRSSVKEPTTKRFYETASTPSKSLTKKT